MRAVRIHAFGTPPTGSVERLKDPRAGPAEVVIRVLAAPVNYVDVITAAGEYQFCPVLPYTPGKGPAGVVLEAGEQTSFVVGDRVLGMSEHGGYAEQTLVPGGQCYLLPDALSFGDAASMSLAFDTAWMALRDRARLQVGESVLVLGATGAVGNAAVQLATAMGAGIVLGAGTDAGRLAEDERISQVIDLSRPRLRESVREQVLAATDGRGVDVVIDPLGGDPFDGAVRSLAWRGRLVLVGFAAGRIPVLKMNYPLLKNIEISGLQISDYRKRAPGLMAECYREVFRFAEGGQISIPPHMTLPLEQWLEGFRMVAERTTRGRVLLVPNG